MKVTFSDSILNILIPTIWLVSTIGLLIDRYWLMRPRLIDQMIAKTKKQGKCVVCERPMKIISVEEDA